MLIGSTSETVARHAPCSVLVVRTSDEVKSNEGGPPLITIASDCSDADNQIAIQLNAMGFPKSAKIQLVSIVEHPYLLEPVYEFDAQVTRETTVAMEKLAKQ